MSRTPDEKNINTRKRINNYIQVLSGLKIERDFFTQISVLGLSVETKQILNEVIVFLQSEFNMYEERPWSEKEKSVFINEYKNGVDREQIAINHQRNIKDINSQIMDFVLDFDETKEIVPIKTSDEPQKPIKKHIQNQSAKKEETQNNKKREWIAFEPPESDFAGKNTTKRKSCKECLSYRKEECFGKNKICDDFKYAPLMDDEKRRNWPRYGDATYFRMTSRKK